jgi:ferredoxin-NADP reductase
MARQILKAKLLTTESLSDQTKHLEFEVKDSSCFQFVPGQFISMLAPKEGKTITRAYSIASAPRDHHFDICLNRVPGGFFSNLLCDLNPGQELDFHGPHGLFVLRQPFRDALFIATGTGIAPMRAFVQWIFADPERHAGKQIYLVYGTRYEKDVYYQEYFESVAHENSNFHYTVTISRPTEAWKGNKGYVQEYIRKIVGERPLELRTDMDAYICGLNDMVSAVRKLLMEEFGWDKKQVIFERYD